MIAIVGGGIAGLAAAYELSVRGVPFRLFEATDRLGGLIRTERIDGFTIEAGADSMLVQKRAAIDLCAELGLASHLIPTNAPRTAFVLHAGRLHPLPSPSMLGIPATWSGLLNFDLLPASARARLAMEPLVRRRALSDDESIGGFFARRFGRASVALIAQPLLGGIHSGDVNTLSLQGLMPRLAQAETEGSVLRWVQRAAHSSTAGGAFRSLSGGMGELVNAIQARLPAGSIQLKAPVDAIEPGWTLAHRRPGVRLQGHHPCYSRACGGTSARACRSRGGSTLRVDGLRLDGKRRARVPAQLDQAPAARHWLRCRSRVASRPDERVHLGLV